METTLNNLENQDHSALFKTKEPDGFIYSEYVAYCESGQFPYIESVAKHIAAKLPPLTDQQGKNLRTHVYYSSCKLDTVRQAQRRDELLSAGWNDANNNTLTAAFVAGVRRIALLRTKESLLGSTGEVTESFKLVADTTGKVFIMKPKARTRGISVEYLWNGYPMFYKEAKS